jgi:hypothetical protein
LARALLEHGATREALRIAEHGLSLEGERLSLARWLRAAAAAAGEPERAVQAGLVAVRGYPSLDEYQAVRALAEERWPALRDELLADLRRAAARFPGAVGEILLHEGRIEDAITVAEAAPRRAETHAASGAANSRDSVKPAGGPGALVGESRARSTPSTSASAAPGRCSIDTRASGLDESTLQSIAEATGGPVLLCR